MADNPQVAAARAELARRQQVSAAKAELARRQATAAPEATPAEYTLPEGHSLETTDRGRFIVTPQGQWHPLEVDGVVNELAQRSVDQNPDDLARAVGISNRAQAIDAGQGTNGGLSQQFLRGAPFVGSFTDEVIGGAAGVMRGEGAEAGRQRALDISDAYAVAKPKSALAANLSGAVVGSIPLAAAGAGALVSRAPATLGGRALMGAGVGATAGAVEGAAYGAGEGSGEGAGDTRAQNAGINAAFGGAGGAVLGVAAPYATAGAKNLLQSFRRSDTSTIARELGVSGPAARVIRTAIDAGDDDAALAAMQRGGDSAMLADANAGTRKLVDTAAQSPGDAGAVARGAVNQRVTGATRQMNSALDEALGPVPEGARGLVGDIMTESSAPRRAAYDLAYSRPISYADATGIKIEGVLNRVDPRVMQDAVKEANAAMRDLGITNQQIRATIGDNGRVVFDNPPDVRQLDALKQGLDAIAENSKNVQGIMSPQGRRAAGQAQSLRSALGEAVPEYNDAVRLGGQAISERNAVDTGRKLLTAGTTMEDVTLALRGASDAELSAARQGVRSYIDDTTARVTRTITDDAVEAREGIKLLRDMSSRANQVKLRRLLGTEQADTLLAQIDEAATGFELRAAIAENSSTYARGAQDAAVEAELFGGVYDTLTRGEPINATKRLVQVITGNTEEAREAIKMGVYKEMAEALVNTRGSQAARALRIISDATEGQRITERQAEFAARTLIGAASGAVPVASRGASSRLSTR